MTLRRIEALLLSKIGLVADTIGSNGVATAVRARMNALGLADAKDYERRLSLAGGELQALIEEVVVSETWFFREPAAYELMTQRALELRSAAAPLRVLSAPCATGEEPYSAVMALLGAGFAPEGIEAYGIDISENALNAAQAGRYTQRSFRSSSQGYRQHFEERAGTHQLSSSVRERVSFVRGNVLDRTIFPGLKFHFIFCRNLLIYLDKGARAVALDNLCRLLRPEGVLFVGHSEAGEVAAHGLVRCGDSRSFAFSLQSLARPGVAPPARASLAFPERVTATRFSLPGSIQGPPVAYHPPGPGRTSLAARPSLVQADVRGAPPVAETPRASWARASVPGPLGIVPSRPARRSVRPGSLRPPRSPAASAPRANEGGEHWLEQARSQADQGLLSEAVRSCERALSQLPRDPDAHSLLGVVQRASGDLRAARASFLAALELDPDHYETLIHLSLLLEHEGDRASANAYRARASSAWKGR